MQLDQNLLQITSTIRETCEQIGRDPESITFIAVSKTVDVSQMKVAYNLGVRDFGESRVQEMLAKVPHMPADVRWHFIGKLQSNKIRKVVPTCTRIHTLESLSQVHEFERVGTHIEACVEVNIGLESQKSGILPQSLDEFVAIVIQCKNILLKGLMTIGPANQNAELSRPYFEQMRMLTARYGLSWLSMGMSNDYVVALQEGATHIRVGSALFGER